MKAVILVAGVGSRLKPRTLDTHKALLPIGDSTTLGNMVGKLSRHGISEFVIVTGNMEELIKGYLAQHFPELTFHYVRNDIYARTNTGYSLLMARPFVEHDTFIKLDGDVNFDERIIEQLVATPDDASYVCVDKTAVDDEVIKVIVGEAGQVERIGNRLPVAESAGESIGIEKIAAASATALFDEIAREMADEANLPNYYEVAYDAVVQAGEPFRVLDITGLDWVEMDTEADYNQAVKIFG